MTLLEAFKRARHAVVTNKADTVGRHVRLINNSGLRPTMTACDGEVTTQYQVDGQGRLPDQLDACVSIDEVLPAIAQAEDVRIQWSEDGATLVLLVTREDHYQSAATLHVLPPNNFKAHGIPDVDGEPFNCDSKAGIVADFTGDDPAAPQYGFVQAHSEGLCATDMCTSVCYQTPVPWNGLVPAALFTRWPASQLIELWDNDHGALVTLSDAPGVVNETRFASFGSARSYPGVWNRMQPEAACEAAMVVVDRKALAQAVKQATGCSTLGCVWLRHDVAGLYVQGHVDKLKGGQAFNGTLKPHHSQGQSPQAACYDGKRLQAVLKAITTASVVISQSQPEMSAPLRVEGGRAVAWIFRTNPEQHEEAEA